MRNRTLKLLSLAGLLLAPFSGCLSDNGTEIPNEVRGTLYTSSGTPAANATVTLYPVGYEPATSSAKESAEPVKISGQTNASGQFAIGDVPEGQYNVLASGNDLYAFQDSLTLTGTGVRSVPADTLRASGTLTGTVQLQPQHSPQTATVQVLGTDYYTNVAANGKFTLTLPRGNYRLRISTILADYVPLFVTVSARSGMNDTISEPFEPFYANIPVITGLAATPDSSGVITLKWKKPTFGNVQTYLIYRDSVGTVTPSTTPYASTEDTVFRDTIYVKRTPGSYQLPIYRYSFLDTVVHAFRYRVRILDVSDNVGPVFGSTLGSPIPLAKAIASGRWHRGLAAAPFGQRLNPSVVNFNNMLWLFGGGSTSVWSSQNGIQWEKTLDSLPIPQNYSTIKATVKDGKIWLLAANDAQSENSSARGIVLSSIDGTSWATAKDSIPLIGKLATLLAFHDTLWAFSGGKDPITNPDPTGPYLVRSVDGINWTSSPPVAGLATANPGRGGTILSVFADKVWVVGGNRLNDIPNIYDYFVSNTTNGISWTPTFHLQSPTIFLGRVDHAVTVHAGKLWSLGGRHLVYPKTGAIESQIWNSENGTEWTFNDIHPYPPRDQPAAISFNGRLWVIGGIQSDGTNDIWYYE